ncbi:MGH1-like glycoside hydrolase domain-containing protein [Marinifilum sp.]|uniref:MGH1-like glycoside hydrolase domain-containing protein n=1 Tax=Marinifilum sp. TaxID=2033137 RepID=UPI003BABE7E7
MNNLPNVIVIAMLFVIAMSCNKPKKSMNNAKDNVTHTSVNMEKMKQIYDELSTEYDRLRPQVIKQPEGYLKYPYLIPAGFYSQLWDWDAFFMANHFISKGQPEFMKYWALTYMENIDEEGYVSGGMTTKGQRKIFGKFAMKPFLSQGIYHYSEAVGDYSWIEPYYDRITKILEYRENTQFNKEFGLYYWEIAMQSGADNNPAMNYFTDDSREFVCADVSAFQYGELLAQSVIAKKLGKQEDAAKFKKAAETLKANINKHLWNAEDKVYYNVDIDSKKHYKRVSYSSFIPLMYKIATPEQGKQTIEAHLTNPKCMKAKYGFRSLSAQDVDYNNKNVIVPFSNWQGPVWPIANYIFSIGLKNYGYDKELAWLAETLGQLLVDDIKEWGIMHENYHADTGAPLAPSADHVDKNGKFVGFISWNLCIQNVMEGVLEDKWMLLQIEE